MFRWQPPVSLNILRNNRGFALARADLKREGNAWKLLDQRIMPMISNTAPADQEIQAAMKGYSKKIAEADSTVLRKGKAMERDEILALYMAALAAVPESNAVLYSRESIREGWAKGELRASAIFNSVPWTTGLVQLDLSGAEFASLRKVKSYEVLRQPIPPADERWKVTTSEFFARSVMQRLKLPPDRVRPLATPPEYRFFAEYLQSAPAKDESAAGWILEKP